jgi:DNA polymerase-3 subunit epsilon
MILLRQIVLDTETTGLDPLLGHRVIEIGAIELSNHIPTQNYYQCYINPGREVDSGAFDVHGLSTSFLSTFPSFKEIAGEFLNFIKDDALIIHNAPFDIPFLNMELTRSGHQPIELNRIIDTLPMARVKFPGAQANLNALCRRFDINNSHRDLHGALVDADLLASVYLELIGGKQPDLTLYQETKAIQEPLRESVVRERRSFPANKSEIEQHTALINIIPDAIWRSD